MNLYSDIFCQTCLPSQINLRLPGNLLIPSDKGDRSKNIPVFPHITTILLKSDTKKTFSIVRIDQINNQWKYSEEQSCMAWSWKSSTLNLSLERNLQISASPTLEKVVFIVYVPFEINRNTKINLHSIYGNRPGKSMPIALKDAKAISDDLLDKKDSSHLGSPLPNNILKEIERLSTGSVVYDDDMKSAIDEKAPIPYKNGPASPSCSMPENFDA